METKNSKNKLDYAVSVVRTCASTRSTIKEQMAQLKAICEKAKYASASAGYNAFVDICNQFDQLCLTDQKVMNDNIETLLKDKTRGANFIAMCKKALDDIMSLGGVVAEYEKIKEVPGGEEDWSTVIQSQYKDCLAEILGVRKKFIYALGGISKQNADPMWSAAYKKIGKANEEFTNSWVDGYNKAEEQLAKINIDLSKEMAEVEEAASSVSRVGTANTNFDITNPDL